VERLTITLLQNLLMSHKSVLIEFLGSPIISQSYGGKVDCLKRPVRRGTGLLKYEELA